MILYWCGLSWYLFIYLSIRFSTHTVSFNNIPTENGIAHGNSVYNFVVLSSIRNIRTLFKQRMHSNLHQQIELTKTVDTLLKKPPLHFIVFIDWHWFQIQFTMFSSFEWFSLFSQLKLMICLLFFAEKFNPGTSCSHQFTRANWKFSSPIENTNEWPFNQWPEQKQPLLFGDIFSYRLTIENFTHRSSSSHQQHIPRTLWRSERWIPTKLCSSNLLAQCLFESHHHRTLCEASISTLCVLVLLPLFFLCSLSFFGGSLCLCCWFRSKSINTCGRKRAAWIAAGVQT